MTLRSRALLAVPVLALGTLVAACDTGSDRGQTIYTPDQTVSARKADPTLTALAPRADQVLISGKAVAGVTLMVLTGTGFVQDSTYVYFNSTRVPIVSLTPTQLVVQAPNLPLNNVAVKVARLGAVNYSQIQNVSLVSAVKRFGAFLPTLGAAGVAPVDTSLAYASLTENAISLGIRQVQRTGHTAALTTTFVWPELAHFSGYVYGVRGVRALFRFKTPSGSQETYTTVSPDGNVQINALDLESDGTIWSGGGYTGGTAANRLLYLTSPTKVTTNFPFGGTITAVEATPTAVYVAGSLDGKTGVWRYPRTGSTLGTMALHAELPTTVVVNTMAATAAGELLLGVAPSDALLNATFVNPLRLVTASGTVTTYMPGLLNKGISHMRWADSRRLLISGASITGNADSQKPAGGDLVVLDALLNAQL